MHAEPSPSDGSDMDVADRHRPMSRRRGVGRVRRGPSPGPTVAPPAGDPQPPTLAPPGAFDDFYRANRDGVARMLALTLGDDGLGYEAADEAMSRAYERWSSVATYANPEGWVYRTGLNWARSWLRRRKVGAAKDLLAARSDDVVDGHHDTDVAAAIARLPHPYRAVVVLRFYRDWSVEQTADALGIASGTVKSRLSRALRKLEGELAEPQMQTRGPHEGDLR